MRKLYYLLLSLAAMAILYACDKDERSEYQDWTVASEMIVARNWATFQIAYLVKKGDQKPWEPFLNQIKGFEFEPGYETRIRVRIDPLSKPMEDGPSSEYTMTEQFSRVQKQSIDATVYTPECELTVASERGIYFGTPCYWVKEPSTGVTRWAPFTASIAGFEYEPGYEYLLRVALEADPGNKKHPIRTIFRELLVKEHIQSIDIPESSLGK